MELWDDVVELDKNIEVEEQIELNSDNKYLSNPIEAQHLIATVFAKRMIDKEYEKLSKKVDMFISQALITETFNRGTMNALHLYKQLNLLKEKEALNQLLPSLLDKTMVAVAGGFSSGKSAFINSLIGKSLLPENQTPTTSIPSYIMKGCEEISGITLSRQKVTLEEEAFKAVSHEFFNVYGINLSSYLQKMVVRLEDFKYENIVLLDTPGYTKADGFKKHDQKDEHIAREQIKTADFLIWLVDIDNGTIKNEDFKFINSLEFSKPILIIFNRADRVPISHREKIVEEARELVKSKGLNVHGVTAYSSRDIIEYTGKFIREFLEVCNSPKESRPNGSHQLLHSIKILLEEEIQGVQMKRDDLVNSIKESEQLTQVSELTSVLIEEELTHRSLIKTKHQFENLEEHLIKLIDASK